MKIVCPSCAADYRMSQDKIPEDGLLIRCPSCNHSFRAYGNGTTASVSDETSPAARGPDEKSVAPPPPPPLDLGDEFDKFGDFESIEFDESVNEISESGGSVDQSGSADVEAYGLTPPPPPPPPPLADDLNVAEGADEAVDDFDFSFGIKQPITENPKASGPLKDLFDDLDDLPAPKSNPQPQFEDLPTPIASTNPFDDLEDLPSPKMAGDSPIASSPLPPDLSSDQGLFAPEVDGPETTASAFDSPSAVSLDVPSSPQTGAASAQHSKGGSRTLLWAIMGLLVLGGGGVAGMMIMEIGPFASSSSPAAKRKKTPKKIKKPVVKTNPKKTDQTASKAPVAAAEKSLDTSDGSESLKATTAGVTMAEIAGYRDEIATLESKKSQLEPKMTARLLNLYAFGSLDYPENTQWRRAGSKLLKGVDPTVKTQFPLAVLASRLADGDKSAAADIEAAVRKAPKNAALQSLLGHARLKSNKLEGAYNAFKRAYRLDKTQLSAQRHAGELALRLGRVQEALATMQALYDVAPGTPRVNIVLAEIENHRGDTSKAVALVTQTLTLKPPGRVRPQDRSDAFVLRARISMKQGNNEAAIGDLKSAVRVWPGNSEALGLLSDEHIKNGRFDEAINQLRALERAGAKSAETSIKIAQCYTQMSRHDRAFEALKDANKKYPHDANVLIELGAVHEAKEEFAEAKKNFEAAIKQDPDSGTARLRIAKLMVKQAKIDPAIEFLTKAAAEHPRDPLMQVGLGDLRVQMAGTVSSGNATLFDQAEGHYRAALNLDPGSLQARRGLLTTLIENRKAREAMAEIKRLQQRTDFYGVLDYELARTNQLLGQFKTALTHYETALKRDPDNVQYLKNAGLTHYAAKDLSAAETSFGRVVHLDTKNTTGFYHLGLIAFRTKRPDQAIQMFQKVLERDKQHHFARYWKGRALQELGGGRSDKTARAEYDMVAKAAKKQPKLKTELCDVFWRRGALMAKNFKEWNAAEKELTEFLKCDSKKAQAWYVRGQLRADLGKLNDAISDFDKAGRLNSGLGKAFANSAYVRMRKPKFDERKVQALLKKAIRSDKTLARPNYILCNMVKEKNKAQAKRYCKTYLKLAPKGDNASEAQLLLRSL